MIRCLYRDPDTDERCKNLTAVGSRCYKHPYTSPTTLRFGAGNNLTLYFDANISLAELTSALNMAEKVNVSELVSLEQSSVDMSNLPLIGIKARFRPTQYYRNSARITLIETKNNSHKDLIINRQMVIGMKLILESSVSIENQAKDVLGFRKIS